MNEVQDAFRTRGRQVERRGRSGRSVARTPRSRIPSRARWWTSRREQLEELLTFLRRQSIVTLPESEPVVVAPSPEFYRWAFASMWTPGPFETKASRAYYYLTDALPSWPRRAAGRAPARLQPADAVEHLDPRGLSRATSSTTSTCGNVASKVRKSTFFAPTSFVEGWAHYCEQMMVEAGFRKGDHAFKLGQLAEALVRLARMVVGIRLHCEDLSVEQGMRFFRDEAYLEEATARREAERGTFDPGYVTYSIGKLMMLKLRQDFKEQQDSKYSLRGFHDAVLAGGSAPFWAHRQLLLGDTASDAAIE